MGLNGVMGLSGLVVGLVWFKDLIVGLIGLSGLGFPRIWLWALIERGRKGLGFRALVVV